MTSRFSPDDLARLQDAVQEVQEFGEFLKDRFVTLGEITGQPPIRRQTLSVPKPTVTVEDPKEPGAGRTFHIRECLGGDRFSVDYREHYMPVDFALGGDDADERLRRQFAEFLRLSATFRPGR